MALNILVIAGSVRRDRIGIRPARYLQQCCLSRGHEATLIDPLDYRLPLLDRMYKEYPPGEAPEALERLAKLINRRPTGWVVKPLVSSTSCSGTPALSKQPAQAACRTESLSENRRGLSPFSGRHLRRDGRGGNGDCPPLCRRFVSAPGTAP